MPTPIIDPHVHQWDLRRTPREASPIVKLLGRHRKAMLWLAPKLFPKAVSSFFGRPDHLLSDYLPEHYETDTAGAEVTGFVHIEAGWRGKGAMGPVAETRWLESLGTPLLWGIVGFADLSLGDAIDVVLRAHLEASPRFRGIRYPLSHHPGKGVWSSCDRPGVSHDAQWRRGYALLGKHGLSFDATVYHHQLDDVASLATDFPEVPIILCHAGTPTAYAGPFGGEGETASARERTAVAWRDSMSRLAELPNVTLKISGLSMPIVGWGYHGHASPSAEQVAADYQPLIDFMVGTFGADRCMFASNFPIDKVSMPWTTLYRAFAITVADRSEDERRALFSETASRIYKLEPRPAP